MNKTVLITGTSSGIGKATAHLFARQGWNVAATARSSESNQYLNQSNRMLSQRLDVTDPSTIKAAVTKALAYFGKEEAHPAIRAVAKQWDKLFAIAHFQDLRKYATGSVKVG